MNRSKQASPLPIKHMGHISASDVAALVNCSTDSIQSKFTHPSVSDLRFHLDGRNRYAKESFENMREFEDFRRASQGWIVARPSPVPSISIESLIIKEAIDGSNE